MEVVTCKSYTASSYLDIGHTNKPCVLWIWAGGRFYHRRRTGRSKVSDHHDYFCKVDLYGCPSRQVFSGRYDPALDMVSLVTGFKRVPSALYRTLEKHWPTATVKVFK